MYEARQRKEKVSRRIDGGGRGNRIDKKLYQFMIDKYAANKNIFEPLMGKFPYNNIPQALRYRTIAYASFNGINLGESFSTASWGSSDHAEDAILDVVEGLISKCPFNMLNGQNESLWNQLQESVNEDKENVLDLYISASPCERCAERIRELAERGVRINITYHNLYRNPNGGKNKSSEIVNMLREKGATLELDEGTIQM